MRRGEDMTKVDILNKNYTINQVLDALRVGKLVVLPFLLNEDVFVINNNMPQKKMVTDISMKAIQLNGVWSTWEQIEAEGGIYDSEFGALTALSQRK